MVGPVGFEPTITRTRAWQHTKLAHGPHKKPEDPVLSLIRSVQIWAR